MKTKNKSNEKKMSKYKKHLYMIVAPVNALLASQLEPEKFGEHFTIGSAKHFKGKVIFAEIDINFRSFYFEIERYLNELKEHEDGSPKKTKFIKSFNVLENIDLDVIKKLYLCTTNGKVLELKPAKFTHIPKTEIIRLYQEITPLENFVASRLDQNQFGKYVTSENETKGAPKILFTQISYDLDEFMELQKKENIQNAGLPSINPNRFYECISELENDQTKKTKTLGLTSILPEISYKRIRHGFWFTDGTKTKFFPMPDHKELAGKFSYWWKYVR